jgi:excisionase family DNA binding protein
MSLQPLITSGEAAERLDISVVTLRRWIKDGKLGYIRLPSGQYRFRSEDVDALLEPTKP